MEQIIIDGINLSDLKVKYDALAKEQADMRQSICKGSSKFIADTVKQALDHVQEMKDAEELSVAEDHAAQATGLLKTVKFVSDVSGVSYSIPYYDRQGEYCPEGEPITTFFEDSDYVMYGANASKDLCALYNLAGEMESEVNEWNASYC